MNKDDLADITFNVLYKKYKDSLKDLSPILDVINEELEAEAKKGNTRYYYPFSIELQNSIQKIKCILKYYKDREFKVLLTVVNSGYKNLRIEAMTISWGSPAVRELSNIFK